jgi:hypothetical protein
MRQHFFNAIDSSVIKEVIDDYNSRNHYQTASMNKTHPGKSLELLETTLCNLYGKKLKFCSGNFYKHKIPYLPHTDFKPDQGNEINFVIPLSYIGEQASLIIFDQVWNKPSVTWCLTRPLTHFEVNTGVPGNPCDYDVGNLTDQEIDQDLYKKYLDHYPKECFFGLSGEAFKFEPTSVIMFDNKHIHCTSKFKGEKLGISLRFKE